MDGKHAQNEKKDVKYTHQHGWYGQSVKQETRACIHYTLTHTHTHSTCKLPLV